MVSWIPFAVIGGAFVVSLFFEDVRDIYEDVWGNLLEVFSYLISFEWLSDVGEIFSNGWEAITNIADSPLTNIWFWVFYACLLAGVWVLPSKLGLADYKLVEKVLYTVIFFIIDWFIIAHFQNT